MGGFACSLDRDPLAQAKNYFEEIFLAPLVDIDKTCAQLGIQQVQDGKCLPNEKAQRTEDEKEMRQLIKDLGSRDVPHSAFIFASTLLGLFHDTLLVKEAQCRLPACSPDQKNAIAVLADSVDSLNKKLTTRAVACEAVATLIADASTCKLSPQGQFLLLKHLDAEHSRDAVLNEVCRSQPAVVPEAMCKSGAVEQRLANLDAINQLAQSIAKGEHPRQTLERYRAQVKLGAETEHLRAAISLAANDDFGQRASAIAIAAHDLHFNVVDAALNECAPAAPPEKTPPKPRNSAPLEPQPQLPGVYRL